MFRNIPKNSQDQGSHSVVLFRSPAAVVGLKSPNVVRSTVVAGKLDGFWPQR